MRWTHPDGPFVVCIILYLCFEHKQILPQRKYQYKITIKEQKSEIEEKLYKVLDQIKTIKTENEALSKINFLEQLEQKDEDMDDTMNDKIIEQKFSLKQMFKQVNIHQDINMNTKERKQHKFQKICLYHTGWKDAHEFIIYYPHIDGRQIIKINGNIFKLYNPKIQIKCGKNVLKDEEIVKVICITDKYDQYIDKIGITKVFTYHYIAFCVKKQGIVFKHQMSREEQKKYLNNHYFCNNLPTFNQNKQTRKKKKRNTKLLTKNSKYILSRISVTRIVNNEDKV